MCVIREVQYFVVYLTPARIRLCVLVRLSTKGELLSDDMEMSKEMFFNMYWMNFNVSLY